MQNVAGQFTECGFEIAAIPSLCPKRTIKSSESKPQKSPHRCGLFLADEPIK
jgi:hypothetical protein